MCQKTYEDTVMGSGSSRGVLAETLETRRTENQFRLLAGSLAGRGFSTGLPKIVDEVDSLLSEHSMANWPSFPKEICEED